MNEFLNYGQIETINILQRFVQPIMHTQYSIRSADFKPCEFSHDINKIDK